ncbi:ATP-binding cassette domain-containing protein [Croceitalea sp. P059]|uniref:ATP-binding cassette domain-containing protein n=1 Tax=Croceitalea sp. P059 TaxID=3075601 RepID=UPI0028882179|nr:ATP-binding cassette domain-containing protein [Croceitalea sp. P059]MDT0540437.1 ATP-binding cassette domain-containing protein [Croceitalea sp. P059]
MKHYAILVDNTSRIEKFITRFINKNHEQFSLLNNKRGAIFSSFEMERFINQEEKYGINKLTSSSQSLKSLSSGEQKKALLHHILNQNPEYIILNNPFDNLDIQSQKDLREILHKIAETTILIQLTNRLEDLLSIPSEFFTFKKADLVQYKDEETFISAHEQLKSRIQKSIPQPLNSVEINSNELVKFKEVSVSFNNKPVLKHINWTIEKSEFWQLIGPNGSGKSTLLNMISGDSHKGYGQNLKLFGIKKGSGESVWDIKKHIGYFTPSLIDTFKGNYSIKNMVISGLYDSIGLYVKPSENESWIAEEWLKVIGLLHKKDIYFQKLSMGEKRLVMAARAMIKHPPLLILDEPTVGLDDFNASLFTNLIHKISKETNVAIIYVSHRNEAEINPDFIYELIMTKEGSIGQIV